MEEKISVSKIFEQIADNESIFAERIANIDKAIIEIKEQLKELQVTLEDIKRFTSNIGK